MAKKIIRKPTREEKRFVDLVASHGAGGLEIYKHDWPVVEPLAADGLIVLSPPRGAGKAFKRAVMPGLEDW